MEIFLLETRILHPMLYLIIIWILQEIRRSAIFQSKWMFMLNNIFNY